MVLMPAEEDPSSEGPLAFIPKRRGMDFKEKSSPSAKKLVQARLPFKRLNPVPKENGEPKRTRAVLAPPCLEPGASDGENDVECSPVPLPHGAALVNGRGPLDCFMSHNKCPLGQPAPSVTIDLTDDTNSADADRLLPAAPASSCCPSVQASSPSKGPAAAQAPSTKSNAEKSGDAAGSPKLASAQALNSHGVEMENEGEEEVSSHGNESILSPSSTSSLSMAESSPETSRSFHTPPSAGPKTNTNTGEKKIKRRSLKSSVEQEEQQRQRQEERLERNRQQLEARAAKERKREEARKLKEEREKEKREKKEKEEREKKEKKEKEEKEKAEKQRAKEEQRKVKQEAKLEEKRKKEEDKRLKEEKDRIKAEKAEITRFLQKPKALQAPKTLAAACGKFAPFEIKENMCLAPLCRVQCEEMVLDHLDRYLAEPDDSLNVLEDWRRHKPRSSGPTRPWHAETVRDCVVVVEGPKPDGVPDRSRCGRMKLLQFHANYRPAYWGTWSKRSDLISPRCPLRQDKELLDYEVDSDEEWEEEEPGESLSHSEGDDEEDGAEDDDDDDGFFVPHGYLSDGEGALEEEESGDPEKQKVRQKLKAREWDELQSKKRCKVLQATVKGCVWESEGMGEEVLMPYAVCLLEPLPREETSTLEGPSRESQNEQLLSQLLPLLHGNVNSSKVIITEFQEWCRKQSATPAPNSPQNSNDSVPTRIRLKRLIKEHAVYEKRSAYRRCCWYVHAEVLSRFSQEALPVPSQWSYITSGAHSTREEPPASLGAHGASPPAAQPSVNTPCSNKRKSTGSMSITKFMKKCGEAEQSMETDGFQADTEEDDDDEPDCYIITQTESTRKDTVPSTDVTQNMEVATSDPAALHLPCPTATHALA